MTGPRKQKDRQIGGKNNEKGIKGGEGEVYNRHTKRDTFHVTWV